MAVAGNLLAQALQYPTCVALGTKKDRTMIIINSDNLESLLREEQADFGSNESAGTGNQNGRRAHQCFLLYLDIEEQGNKKLA